ncbi:MAG: LAGLIDADG family homing endonuclease, partial [Methanosarcinales archaeon]
MKVTKEVIELIQRGVSINNISKQTGFAKSTIYHHYKKIKGKRFKEIKLNFKNENELGEFLGIFSGDGYFRKDKNYHYTTRIYTGYYESDYVEYLKRKLHIWFNKKPQIFHVKYENRISCVVFSYDSKKIYLLLKKYLDWEGKKAYTIKLKKLDLNNKEFNIGFLRGLIDTDGNFYAPKRRISFAAVSDNLIRQVNKIIVNNCNLQPKYFELKKNGRANLHTLSLHGKHAKSLIKQIKPS